MQAWMTLQQFCSRHSEQALFELRIVTLLHSWPLPPPEALDDDAALALLLDDAPLDIEPLPDEAPFDIEPLPAEAEVLSTGKAPPLPPVSTGPLVPEDIDTSTSPSPLAAHPTERTTAASTALTEFG